MNAFRKLVAFLMICFIVLPIGTATLFFISIGTWALDRDFYTNIFDNDKLYELLLTEEIPSSIKESDPNDAIPESAIIASMREILTPESMHDLITPIVDDFFDFMDGVDPIFDPILNIRPIKASLQGEGGSRFAQVFAENLKPCPAGETGRESGITPYTYTCLPAGMTTDDVAAAIEDSLMEWVDAMPDEMNIMDTPANLEVDFFETTGTEDYIMGDSPRAALTSMVSSLLILTLIFWLLSGFIGGNYMRGRLIWLGITLLILALPTFLIGIGMRGAINEIVLDSVAKASYGSVEFDYAMREIFLDAADRVINSFMMTGGVTFALGVGLYVWGLVTKRPMTDDDYYAAKGKPKYEYDGLS